VDALKGQYDYFLLCNGIHPIPIDFPFEFHKRAASHQDINHNSEAAVFITQQAPPCLAPGGGAV
jgi:hypothetical protein